MGDRKTTTSSGHYAGIQSSKSFGERELALKREREDELKRANMNSNSQQETVYRDRKGKKLDVLTEYMHQQSDAVGKKAKIDQAQQEWGQGSFQKKQREVTAKELEEIAAEPFARTVDDPKLEAIRKQELRDGDPLFDYFAKKQEQLEDQAIQTRGNDSSANSSTAVVRSSKPKYKGPIPTPNRFGILPGYRWDAINRGNGFEHKILTQMNDKKSLKDDEYMWSVSDL